MLCFVILKACGNVWTASCLLAWCQDATVSCQINVHLRNEFHFSDVHGAMNTRTEQLTKCCEPLQKMRVRLGPCKTGLSPPPPPSNFILLVVPRRYFCFGSNGFVFWSRMFVLFEPYVRFHILVQFR